MTTPRTHHTPLILVVLATLALAGCVGLPRPPAVRTPSPGSPVMTAASATTAAAPAAGSAAGSGAGSGGGGTPLPVLATRSFALSGGEVEVAITTFAQEGETLTLDFTVTNDSAEPLEAVRFGTGRRAEVDGIYVVDAAHGRRHLPARSADGSCVCSSTMGLAVHPGQSLTFSVVFGALPEGVTSATVVIPLAGSFVDLPVTR